MYERDDDWDTLTPSTVERFADEMRVEPTDYLRLLRTFLERNHERLDELQRALHGKDAETALRVIHSIKGTSLTLRLKEMAKVAERIEAAMKQGQFDGHEDGLSFLKRSLEKVAMDYQRTNPPPPIPLPADED